MTPTITTTTGDALSHTLDAAKRVILSVGSGDGSQQASIVRAGHSNMVSTFYDTETAAYSKYGRTAKEHITFLERSSTAVLFQVDATKLHEHPHLQGTKFDIILFTFPHTGVSNFERLCRGPSPTSIKGNKRLIRDFLKSAQRVLKLDGEILVTLKTTAPYDQWSFPDFADYEVEPVSTHNFDANLFPGYVHRSTEKRKSIGTVVKNGAAKMYVFGSKKRKHQALNEDTNTTTGYFHPEHPFKLSIQLVSVCDEDIENVVVDVLPKPHDNTPKKLNVLDIRRLFPEAIRPDTRQLNRVLYAMEAKGRLEKGPSNFTNQKPTWTPVSTSTIGGAAQNKTDQESLSSEDSSDTSSCLSN